MLSIQFWKIDLDFFGEINYSINEVLVEVYLCCECVSVNELLPFHYVRSKVNESFRAGVGNIITCLDFSCIRQEKFAYRFRCVPETGGELKVCLGSERTFEYLNWGLQND